MCCLLLIKTALSAFVTVIRNVHALYVLHVIMSSISSTQCRHQQSLTISHALAALKLRASFISYLRTVIDSPLDVHPVDWR